MNTKLLDELKTRLDKYRPLPNSIVANLQEDLRVRWTYNSNAIEGNTLTLQETKVVLEGITVGGKTLKEHLEAVNHAEAIEMVSAMTSANSVLTERELKDIHSLILQGIDSPNAGRFRTVNVKISGARHIPPTFLHLREEMDSFWSWYNGLGQALHPVERAARVHADFVKIHPFVDGNGRTARLIMNLELMRGGFPPVVVEKDHRLTYYSALDQAHVEGDYSNFFKLTEQLVKESFKPYWFALGLKDPEIEMQGNSSGKKKRLR